MIVSDASDTRWGGYRFHLFMNLEFSLGSGTTTKKTYISTLNNCLLCTTLHRTFHKVVRSEFGWATPQRSKQFKIDDQDHSRSTNWYIRSEETTQQTFYLGISKQQKTTRVGQLINVGLNIGSLEGRRDTRRQWKPPLQVFWINCYDWKTRTEDSIWLCQIADMNLPDCWPNKQKKE